MREVRIPESLSARDLAAIVFRRWLPIVLTQGCILLVVGLYAFFWPPTYEATVRFLVKNDRVEPVISADQRSIRTIARAGVSEADLNAEAALLQSAAVLEGTVDDLRLDTLPRHWALELLEWPVRQAAALYNAYHERPDATKRQQTVSLLARRLDVEPEQKSSIIQVRLRWGHPHAAEEILQKLSEHYVAQHLAVRRMADSQAFFKAQMERKRAELDDIAARIAAIRPAATVTMLMAERDMAARQVSDFEGQWRKARASRDELTARIQALEQQLAQLPEQLTLEDRSIVNAQTLDALKARVLDLRLQRKQLAQKYAPTHRMVVQVDTLLAEAEAMLRQEEDGTYNERTTGRNSAADHVRQEIVMSRAQLEALEALDEGMRRQQAAMQHTVQQYDADLEELRALDVERTAAEAAYLQYLRQYEEARTSDGLTQAAFANAVAIEPVRAGSAPVKPNRSLLLKLALSVGLLVSFGVGILAEALDHRIHRARDVESATGLPVLGVLDTYATQEARQ